MADRHTRVEGTRTQNVSVGGKKTKYSAWIKALSIFLSVLIIGYIGAVVWIYKIYKDIGSSPLSVFQKENEPVSTIIGTDNTVYVKHSSVVNILLLGIDSDEEREEEHMGYRSDVMILCSVDFSKNIMVMVSIPRDLYVQVNTLDYKTGEIKSRSRNKINAAYQFGGGPGHYGAQNAVDAVEEFISCNGQFDIAIDYYISIDMDGLPKLADAVGGVEVVLDRTLSGVGSKGETLTVTSENIDEYIRRRKGDGGGDPGRNARQQEFIVEFVRKVKSMGTVNAVTSLYDEVMAYVDTNLSLEEILALASFADGFDLNSIVQYRVATSYAKISGKDVELANEEELYNFILEYFYHADEQD